MPPPWLMTSKLPHESVCKIFFFCDVRVDGTGGRGGVVKYSAFLIQKMIHWLFTKVARKWWRGSFPREQNRWHARRNQR